MAEPHIGITGKDESGAPTSFGKGTEFTQTAEAGFLEYFGLNEQPFGVTPDPRFLYLGPKHRQALTALTYGTASNRGFLTLIAKPGMGKTTLLFQFLESLRGKARTVFLFQTDGDSSDLMRNLLADLNLDGKGKDLPEMRLMLNQFLIQEMDDGRPFILVIDEAQNLDEKVLESVRLLSNFETPWMKLMQIVLAGQPQLGERLAKPSMAQLRQRVSFAIRIEPFTREEVSLYVDHRLWVAGYEGPSLFSIGARELLAEQSGGTPRNINNICFYAMSSAWATKQKSIGREMMSELLIEMDLETPSEKAALAPKSVEEPKYSVSQTPPPAVLTLKEIRNRGWLQKVVFMSAILFALGWAEGRFDFGSQLGDSWQEIPAAVKRLLAPAPAPVSLDPARREIPDDIYSGQRSETPADEMNPGPSQLGGTQSARSSKKLR